MQFVRVHTGYGWVVLASNVRHTARPCYDPHHIVPGHDPLVVRHYPPPKPELEGVVVRLDVMPKE
jgi:hypothetical protein